MKGGGTLVLLLGTKYLPLTFLIYTIAEISLFLVTDSVSYVNRKPKTITSQEGLVSN